MGDKLTAAWSLHDSCQSGRRTQVFATMHVMYSSRIMPLMITYRVKVKSKSYWTARMLLAGHVIKERSMHSGNQNV